MRPRGPAPIVLLMFAVIAVPEILKKCKPLAKSLGDILVSAGKEIHRLGEVDVPSAKPAAEAATEVAPEPAPAPSAEPAPETAVEPETATQSQARAQSDPSAETDPSVGSESVAEPAASDPTSQDVPARRRKKAE